jgi:hypothetical protein
MRSGAGVKQTGAWAQLTRGFVRFHEIQSDRNNKCVKKIMIETWIYSGSRINLLIMIGRTRDTKSRIGSTPLYKWIASESFGVSIMNKFIVNPE